MRIRTILFIALLSGSWLFTGCSKDSTTPSITPSITASTQTVAIPALGGEALVTLEANVEWTVTGDPWITATKEGQNTLKIQASANRETARLGKVVCTAQTAFVEITVSQGVVTIAQSDSLALVALYHTAGGANWTQRWILTNPLVQWRGVTIANGRVVALNVSNNNLVGAIPEDMNRLTSLVVLDLSENKLTGNIPTMAALTNLKLLDLSENNFTAATIPAFLSGLIQLEDLRLSHANLTGALPDGLSALVKLHTLDISRNTFTGSIPNWAALVKLRVIYLYNSALSGAIPTFVANLPALEWLALDGNELTGAIPDGNYTRLEKLWLINNHLTGDIPAAIKNSPKWSTFHVCSGNNLNNCTGDNANPAYGAYSVSAATSYVHEAPPKSLLNEQ